MLGVGSITGFDESEFFLGFAERLVDGFLTDAGQSTRKSIMAGACANRRGEKKLPVDSCLILIFSFFVPYLLPLGKRRAYLGPASAVQNLRRENNNNHRRCRSHLSTPVIHFQQIYRP